MRLTWLSAVVASILIAHSVDAQSLRIHDSRLNNRTISAGISRVDSTMRTVRRRTLIGAAVGGVAGAALGYELARVAHRAFCEGADQCAEYPRRAIHSSVIGGAVVGVLLGTAAGWITSSSNRYAPISGRSNVR